MTTEVLGSLVKLFHCPQEVLDVVETLSNSASSEPFHNGEMLMMLLIRHRNPTVSLVHLHHSWEEKDPRYANWSLSDTRALSPLRGMSAKVAMCA